MAAVTTRPEVLVLDVNETLIDLSPLGRRLEEVGVEAGLLQLWFSGTLRDGIALTAAGAFAPFAEVARAALLTLLAAERAPADADRAVEHVMEGWASLELHEDARRGLERLHERDVRLVTLSNGAVETTRGALQRAGVEGLVEQCLSVEQVGRWKPAPEPYLYAAAQCGTAPERMMLVAAHPWDVQGAKRAGLAGAWINRSGTSYPAVLEAPDATARDLEGLAAQLTG